ncbi:MAG: hypothetical protein WCB68_19310 [Pyrinomonadaceae bacterium]
MFEDFDFSLLDDPNFKEDSVREEIVAPLFRALGYSAGGPAKIIRSKTLIHPFVYIGSKSYRVNIVPDYFLEVDENHKWILDAKSPVERIDKGKNPEQAFSYAIHPEVRAQKYALCNGRELAVFDISRIQPLLHLKVSELNEKFVDVLKILSPAAFTKPHIFNFRPDFGLYMWKLGATDKMIQHFLDIGLPFVAKVEDDLYTFSVGISFEDFGLLASFDFNEERYQELLSSVTEEQAQKLKEGLKRQPFTVKFENDPPIVRVVARLQEFFHSNENEDYSPLIVENFDKAV